LPRIRKVPWHNFLLKVRKVYLIFGPIKTKNEAYKVIRTAALLMFILFLISTPIIGYKIKYLQITIQTILLVILCVYYSRAASVLLVIDALIGIIQRSILIYFHHFSLNQLVIPFIILLLCIRSLYAAIKIHGFPTLPCLLKIYFSFYVLTVACYVIFVALNGVKEMNEYISIPINLLFLTGFYGLICKKGIFFNQFWKLFFVIVVLWDIPNNLYYYSKFKPMDLKLSRLILSLFFITCSLPSYIILYVYGYKSKQIWNPQKLELTKDY